VARVALDGAKTEFRRKIRFCEICLRGAGMASRPFGGKGFGAPPNLWKSRDHRAQSFQSSGRFAVPRLEPPWMTSGILLDNACAWFCASAHMSARKSLNLNVILMAVNVHL